MNEQRIQELKDSLVQLVQAIEASGQTGPEINQLLVQAMEHVAIRIQELRQQEQIPQKTPELPQAEYPSSQINAFKYDPKNKRLFVKFQDKYPGTNGPIYSYENVPDYIYNIFSRGAVAPKTSGRNAWHEWRKGITPSLGAAMNALIKAGGFQYQRLS